MRIQPVILHPLNGPYTGPISSTWDSDSEGTETSSGDLFECETQLLDNSDDPVLIAIVNEKSVSDECQNSSSTTEMVDPRASLALSDFIRNSPNELIGSDRSFVDEGQHGDCGGQSESMVRKKS